MNCAKVRRKFGIRCGFSESRLEAQYLAKSYEMVVATYKWDYLQRNPHDYGTAKVDAIHKYRKRAWIWLIQFTLL